MTNIHQRLAGKTCIVTGSGGSIGRATALRFAAEGANVVGCDIAVPSAEETVRLVQQAGGSMMSVTEFSRQDEDFFHRRTLTGYPRYVTEVGRTGELLFTFFSQKPLTRHQHRRVMTKREKRGC